MNTQYTLLNLPAPAEPIATGGDLDQALSRAGAGDRAAFAELYDQLSPSVFGLLLRMLDDRARSEELLEQVFLEVWSRAQEGSIPQFSARPWVLAIAHRHASELVELAA